MTAAALRPSVEPGQTHGQDAHQATQWSERSEEAKMTDVSTFEDIEMAADAVWHVIGDFGGIRKWAVLVQSETVGDSPSGKVRTLVMPDDRVIKERLVVQSQYSYTYAMVERPEMADYRSTVAVVPLDDKHCRIALIMHMTPTEGQTDEEITARYTRNLRGNLRAMKKALGLPL
jgi:hypothetical protein